MGCASIIPSQHQRKDMTNSNALAVRVREYFDANPNALVSDIARLFGITVNHAKRILMSGG
jgi:hypothetical protein